MVVTSSFFPLEKMARMGLLLPCTVSVGCKSGAQMAHTNDRSTTEDPISTFTRTYSAGRSEGLGATTLRTAAQSG